jgi:LPS export ABC transporter protein LptC
LVVAVLVLVVLVGAGLLARNFLRQRTVDLALEMIEHLPDVAQRIENFHRVKVEGGRKVWEVSAKEARYLDGEAIVSVQEPVIAVFFEEGRTVGMRGRSGKVVLAGKDVDRVEVEGQIDVQIDQYSIRTEFARYEADNDRIVVPGAVRVESAEVEFDGDGMEIDLGEQRLRVSHNVRMTLWPKS